MRVLFQSHLTQNPSLANTKFIILPIPCPWTSRLGVIWPLPSYHTYHLCCLHLDYLQVPWNSVLATLAFLLLLKYAGVEPLCLLFSPPGMWYFLNQVCFLPYLFHIFPQMSSSKDCLSPPKLNTVNLSISSAPFPNHGDFRALHPEFCWGFLLNGEMGSHSIPHVIPETGHSASLPKCLFEDCPLYVQYDSPMLWNEGDSLLWFVS